jgi:hypothetical protein
VKVNAGAINSDATLALTYKSMRDPTYGFMAGYDRMTYVE